MQCGFVTENLFHLTNSGRVAEVQREKGTFGGFFCSRPVILKSHLGSRSWFMQSGRADPHSRATTSTILSKENKIKYRPPSFPAALKTRKQTPTSVFILLMLCTAHTPQGTSGACVQTSMVVLHQAPWWCERFRLPAPLPLLCWMLPVIRVLLLSLQICCYGEKSQALNIELPVISTGVCCVQVSVGVY